MKQRLRLNKVFRGILNRSKRQSLSLQKWCIKKGLLKHPFDEKLSPVIVNSIPKSGTHLLSSVVGSISEYKFFGDFIASTPSRSLREVPEEKIKTKLANLLPNEIVHSHLFHRPVLASTLSDLNIKHLLIIRDPRDILCSEVEYLTHMAPWHAMHKHFIRLDNLDDRIALGIQGIQKENTDITYDRIEFRIGNYLGWLDDPHCFVVRYEDLNGENKSSKVREIIDHLIPDTISTDSRQLIEAQVAENTSPHRSHTFNKGAVGRWKRILSKETKALFKECSGDILVKLGYEEDANW